MKMILWELNTSVFATLPVIPAQISDFLQYLALLEARVYIQY
jgi:hypothetical protein